MVKAWFLTAAAASSTMRMTAMAIEDTASHRWLISCHRQCHWCQDLKHLPVSQEGRRKQLVLSFPLLSVSRFKSQVWAHRGKGEGKGQWQTELDSVSLPSIIYPLFLHQTVPLDSLFSQDQAFLFHSLSQYLLNIFHASQSTRHWEKNNEQRQMWCLPAS